MGKPAYIGDVKAGCALKLIQNLMGMSINAVCSESIKLAKLANIPKEQFIEQISNSGAFSFQFKNTASGTFDEDFEHPVFTVNLPSRTCASASRCANPRPARAHDVPRP